VARPFRLRMARQAGEKLARDEGFAAWPVCPFTIAKRHELQVEKKPPGMSGVSGALIFVEPNPIIIYSSEHENEGFERFSISHELGHYFLPDHPEEIRKAGGTHLSRAGFSEGNIAIELEADHFAAGVLMPEHLVRRELEQGQIGLAGVKSVAREAIVSLTAAAIRAAECARFPLCTIVSTDSQVLYAFPSDAFKDLGQNIYLRKGSALPDPSATLAFNADAANVAEARETAGTCRLKDWFDTDKDFQLDEEVIGLGRYGLTLTVLSSEQLGFDPDDQDEETDEEIQERWTPRFAYGR
jgi:hypothetical protein